MTRQRVVRYGVIALGVCYVVLAYAGFAVISDNTTNVGGGLYGGNSADLVLGVFGVNTAMNFIHILLGAGAILGGVVLDRSSVITWGIVVGFVLLTGYGVIAMLANTGTMSLAVTWGDNILHFATAVVLAVAASQATGGAPWPKRSPRSPLETNPSANS